MAPTGTCRSCGRSFDQALLDGAHDHAFWRHPDGACPACVQQALLTTLLDHGEQHFADSVQHRWPLDAEAAFGALPTPLRLRADPRFTGRGVAIAIADSGFTPHPDLREPRQRIRAWVDATCDPVVVRTFAPDELPQWPGSAESAPHQWHGTMTSVVAAGNGYRSHGLYRGMAPESDVVLLHLADGAGRLSDMALLRALTWLDRHGSTYGVRVVSLSVAGDAPSSPMLGPIEAAIERLVECGITVVAAAGNDGVRRLVPPATAPSVITVGGLDDRNAIGPEGSALWHSNFGESATGVPKPELVAPSLWVAAPILLGSSLAVEATSLFARRREGDPDADRQIAERKLITPAYQHVEGTSFAAPIVAGTVACLLEANGDLDPSMIRELLIRGASPVTGADPARQGAGALDAGRAIALGLMERHRWTEPAPLTPITTPTGPMFRIHDHRAAKVAVYGSWDSWSAPIPGRAIEPGLWTTRPVPLGPGEYQYKIKLNDRDWVADPANPWRASDGVGGINSRFRWPPGG